MLLAHDKMIHMCFSATASFAAASVLTLTGVVSMQRAWKTPMIWYAALPLLFGIQQAIEGVQWLLDKPSAACSVAGYGFLFFALLLWPVYVPFSIYMMEKDKYRKAFLRFVTFMGLMGSLYLLVPYLTAPLNISAAANSIQYNLAIPSVAYGLWFYVFVVSSGIWSSRRRVQIFAVVVVLGFFVAQAAYIHALTSVWCFFAGLSSLLVFLEVNYATQNRKIKRRV